MKQIILNADDFGPSSFLNNGIIDGIRNGVVNSVSVFVNYGRENLLNVKRLQEFCKEYGYEVKIGLHFTMTAGYPIAPIKKISNIVQKIKGKWHFKLASELDLDVITCNEIKTELKAQLELLAQVLNIPIHEIDHINNHQGIVYFHDPFWKEFLSTANEYNIPIRSPLAYHTWGHPYLNNKRLIKKWLPINGDGLGVIIDSIFNGNGDDALELIPGTQAKSLKKKKKEAEHAAVAHPSYFIAHYYKQASVNKIHHFLKYIQSGEVAEFMLHLGKGAFYKENYWGIKHDSYAPRIEELKSLKDSNIKELIQHYNIQLVNYSTMQT
ncbi:MAG: ChbG/HpnK family deacetylase [Flavobacteriales bacterium]|jgi:predicted glycoside hydrolase/deacetylase ChbG (UPF0249 family)|nr:ChbG/HpnK family deacetylase [Flavobacteriales bacterium]